MPGSSPLTRGKRGLALVGGGVVGLIPAHAGKTRSSTLKPTRPRAHPRSRGENWPVATPKPSSRGSSPLTRGKLPCGRASRARSGLIPAHAGKTLSATSSQCVDWAHPRSRGENGARGLPEWVLEGSSPLTRGKHRHDHPDRPPRGLIPAHAGKTGRAGRTSESGPAHPRSRGENEIEALLDPEQQGSSPLTRGKLHARDQRPGHPGLIPAHAGKTRGHGMCRTRPAAHPRSRGENITVRAGRAWRWGSSPLTRGKLVTGLLRFVTWGLIPAHAGKTGAGAGCASAFGAHPRSRGENASKDWPLIVALGSSPLTRGKQAGGLPPLRTVGLIPAHAGKTS